MPGSSTVTARNSPNSESLRRHLRLPPATDLAGTPLSQVSLRSSRTDSQIKDVSVFRESLRRLTFVSTLPAADRRSRKQALAIDTSRGQIRKSNGAHNALTDGPVHEKRTYVWNDVSPCKVMRKRGLEPPRAVKAHQALNLARLPIPPLARAGRDYSRHLVALKRLGLGLFSPRKSCCRISGFC